VPSLPLPFGTLAAGTGQAGEHHEPVAGQVEVDIF
jgi:hypothetical protein